MTISSEAARQAVVYALATPRTGWMKLRRDRSDFGSGDSHFLKVRRVGRDYLCGNNLQDGDFGIYLGQQDSVYVVAVQSIIPGHIIGCEEFATPGDLKARWELD